MRYESTAAGPTVRITFPEPTKRLAPMMPPSVIMVTWRGRSFLCASGTEPAAVSGEIGREGPDAA
ncbi:hypothetical protein GCM10009786_01360 [Leucobacter alluvii]|uniref:Uncharacterized protein n=1 Tax=Leucobacter alluvii TaxID=340321 RepID=A0ABN3B2I0_9MICO